MSDDEFTDKSITLIRNARSSLAMIYAGIEGVLDLYEAEDIPYLRLKTNGEIVLDFLGQVNALHNKKLNINTSNPAPSPTHEVMLELSGFMAELGDFIDWNKDKIVSQVGIEKSSAAIVQLRRLKEALGMAQSSLEALMSDEAVAVPIERPFARLNQYMSIEALCHAALFEWEEWVYTDRLEMDSSERTAPDDAMDEPPRIVKFNPDHNRNPQS